MSRAIPANFNQYLLDQTSRNTGVVCDGGIMPLRNDQDPTSLWWKNCLRGEDIVFLKEAVAARRDDTTNDGLNDLAIRAARLQQLQVRLGQMFSSGIWTDTDPRQAIGIHDFGSTLPTTATVVDYIKTKLNPIAQQSSSDTYDIINLLPVQHMFQDVKSLAYVLRSSVPYAEYQGYNRTTSFSYRDWTRDGQSQKTTTVTTNGWMWQSMDQETVRPTLDYQRTFTPLQCTTTFTEQSGYRRFNRYVQSIPLGVFQVENEYQANWTGGSDSWLVSKYMLGLFPQVTYIDTLTQTTLTLNNQSIWQQWAAGLFSNAGLQAQATNITGQYSPTAATRSRTRSARISGPLCVVWISRMMYCSLDGVAV